MQLVCRRTVPPQAGEAGNNNVIMTICKKAWHACAGETQACAEAAAERVTFLEEQISTLNAEAEKAAKDAEEALAAAQAEAFRQLATLQSEKDAALAKAQALLSASQVRERDNL